MHKMRQASGHWSKLFLRRWAPYMLALAPLLFVVVMLVAPSLRLVWEGIWGQDLAMGLSEEAGTGPAAGNTWSIVQDPDLRWRMGWSLMQATATCLLALVLGVPLAWVLARWQFTGRDWVLRLLMLPFVVPTLVAALGVLALWGPCGWRNWRKTPFAKQPAAAYKYYLCMNLARWWLHRNSTACT